MGLTKPANMSATFLLWQPVDVHRHPHALGATATAQTLDRRASVVIAADGQADVAIVGGASVRDVNAHPSPRTLIETHIDPRVTGQFRLVIGKEVSADIARADPQTATGAQHDVGLVLTNAKTPIKRFKRSGLDIGSTAAVAHLVRHRRRERQHVVFAHRFTPVQGVRESGNSRPSPLGDPWMCVSQCTGTQEQAWVRPCIGFDKNSIAVGRHHTRCDDAQIKNGVITRRQQRKTVASVAPAIGHLVERGRRRNVPAQNGLGGPSCRPQQQVVHAVGERVCVSVLRLVSDT